MRAACRAACCWRRARGGSKLACPSHSLGSPRVETTYEVAKRAAFRAADVALAASGTVSLELAANDTPMVIAYDMGWLSRQIIGRMLITDTVTLVNLVTDTRVIPEFIGKNCRADLIATALLETLNMPQGN